LTISDWELGLADSPELLSLSSQALSTFPFGEFFKKVAAEGYDACLAARTLTESKKKAVRKAR